MFVFNYQSIDNPRTHAWYSMWHGSTKQLIECLKEIHQEYGLVIKNVSNKSKKTSFVTQICLGRVPLNFGIWITSHKSQGAYAHYDKPIDFVLLVWHKCARRECHWMLVCESLVLRARGHICIVINLLRLKFVLHNVVLETIISMKPL